DIRERAAQRQKSFAFIENCANWLARARSSELERHAPTTPKVKDHLAEVTKLRAELESLRDAWNVAECAPVPVSILREQAIAEIDQIASQGALSINPRDRTGTPLRLRQMIQIALHDGERRQSIVG